MEKEGCYIPIQRPDWGRSFPSVFINMLEEGGEQEKALLQEWIEKIEIPVIFKDRKMLKGITFFSN